MPLQMTAGHKGKSRNKVCIREPFLASEPWNLREGLQRREGDRIKDIPLVYFLVQKWGMCDP